RLYDQPANLFVAGFIGTPPMNLLQAEVAQENGSYTLSVGGQLLRLADQTLARYPGGKHQVGKTIVLGIRSDHLLPARGHDDPTKLTARLDLIEALGSHSVLYFRTEANALREHLTDAEDAEEHVDAEGVTATRPNLVASFPARDTTGLEIGQEIPIAVDVQNG